MEPIETLTSFSEFALALAGFAAISLAMGGSQGRLPSGSAYVVQYMVVNALGPALLAVLAVVLLELGLPPERVYRTCSGILLAAAAFFITISIRQERILASAGDLALPMWLNRALWAAAAVAHAVQLSNLIGYPMAPSAGLMLLGLWILVLLAGVQFVALLFFTLSDAE